ncbi:MAG: hypothetical protein QOK39_2402, partial [Acidimicrobiaceae bacterium]|nr:hypothetical protein [Acidimicrobiaceae bacterium]
MRHHGGVATACIHGFAPGTCLICQTLDGPRVAEAPRAVAPAGTGEATKAVVPSR